MGRLSQAEGRHPLARHAEGARFFLFPFYLFLSFPGHRLLPKGAHSTLALSGSQPPLPPPCKKERQSPLLCRSSAARAPPGAGELAQLGFSPANASEALASLAADPGRAFEAGFRYDPAAVADLTAQYALGLLELSGEPGAPQDAAALAGAGADAGGCGPLCQLVRGAGCSPQVLGLAPYAAGNAIAALDAKIRDGSPAWSEGLQVGWGGRREHAMPPPLAFFITACWLFLMMLSPSN